MIGMVLLGLSALLALLQSTVPAIKQTKSVLGYKIVATITALSAFLVGTAFFYLIYKYISSDFSFLNVALNSHQSTSLLYKIAGVWGNHEGSMILWLFLLTVTATMFALFSSFTNQVNLKTLQISGVLSFGFHLFVLLTSNPFVQLQQVPKQGRGLNPLLEDPSLLIHPPVLYTGLSLLSIIFSVTCAALQTRNLNQAWAKKIKPWVLIAWCFLTLGISLGSWWAYYELGWGGWWFWDPVENISLLPWLAITALIHNLIVAQNRGQQLGSAALLAMGSFALAVIGLFLVRSGALSSVHAFALDPVRGGSLGLIAVLITIAMLWSYFKYRPVQEPLHNSFLSKETALYMNVFIFFIMISIVFLGTCYPLVLDKLTGQKISVGAPYFNSTVLPFFTIILLLITINPFLAWRKTSVADFYKQLGYISTAGLGTFIIVLYWYSKWSLIGLFIFSAAVCVIISTLVDLTEKIRGLGRITLKYSAMSLGHLSIAVVVIGATIDSMEKTEQTEIIKVGGELMFQGYNLALKDVNIINAPYFQREQATLQVKSGSSEFTLLPEKRYYPIYETLTIETAIKAIGLSDMYAVLGPFQGEDRWTIKLSWHPAIRIIWIGAGLMILSGILSFIATFYNKRHS